MLIFIKFSFKLLCKKNAATPYRKPFLNEDKREKNHIIMRLMSLIGLRF